MSGTPGSPRLLSCHTNVVGSQYGSPRSNPAPRHRRHNSATSPPGRGENDGWARPRRNPVAQGPPGLRLGAWPNGRYSLPTHEEDRMRSLALVAVVSFGLLQATQAFANWSLGS